MDKLFIYTVTFFTILILFYHRKLNEKSDAHNKLTIEHAEGKEEKKEL